MAGVENGSYVTRAELRAHLEPIREDVAEIRTDVKSLLGFQAASAAISSWQRFWIGTAGVGGLGALATLVWLAHG